MKLYLCEKPSQARDIAAVLNVNKKVDGYITNASGDVQVTWAIGHLLQQLNPEEYSSELKQWSMSTLPIIPDAWKMKSTPSTSKQFKIVSSLIKKATEIVIATDADREGEVIGVELLEINNYKGNRSRLWLSALDTKSIKKALADVRPASDTYPLYEAGLGRQRADWLYGMSVTRGLTIANRGRVDGVLNAGRVQTPTLKLVVDRDYEIENFKAIDYYDIYTKFVTSNDAKYSGKLIPSEAMLTDDYLTDKSLAQNIANTINNRPNGVISEYVAVTKKTAAPLGYSLSQLQKECSSMFGYKATSTLGYAQSLYETHKATTYPRSDCRHLPEEQESEITSVLEALYENNAGSPIIKKITPTIDASKRSKIWNTKKVTAHHAIIPTAGKFNVKNLSPEELNVYVLIRNNFLMQFLGDYIYDSVRVKTKVDDYFFETRSNSPKDLGWKVLNTKPIEKDEDESETKIPVLKEGEVVSVDGVEIKSKKTKPKARFTEGSLIDAMKNIAKFVEDPELKKILRDNSGIGTEATRANIIEKLLQTNYIVPEGKKSIISTEKGRLMISVAPDLLKNPETTSVWEQALDDVSNSKKTLSEFMHSQEQALTNIIDEIKSGKSTLKTTVTQHECKTCNSILIKRKGKNGHFWACSSYPDCKRTYQDASGKPQYEQKPRVPVKSAGASCPKCDSDIVERKGKFGVFYACSGFPKCKAVFNKKDDGKFEEKKPK